LVLNAQREIWRHVTHYLPTSTPTALLTREGIQYVPNFDTFAREYEVADNVFTISLVTEDGKHFQYVGHFDMVMEFESNNDKYCLELDLGTAMEAGVVGPEGDFYEFNIEKMVMHTGYMCHEVINNGHSIRQLFVRYGPRLEFTCFDWNPITNEKTIEFDNRSGVGIEHMQLEGI
jgi:hypothetical protein